MLMDFFKKIDFPVQIVFFIICWLPLAISPMMAMLWMYTLPLLGLWQIISVVMHIKHHTLTSLHKLYLKISGVTVLSYIIIIFLLVRDFNAGMLWGGVFTAFALALFYLYISFKTRKL